MFFFRWILRAVGIGVNDIKQGVDLSGVQQLENEFPGVWVADMLKNSFIAVIGSS
jgi:hypothetical protein